VGACEYLSWSRVQLYLRCPRAFWYRYIEGVPSSFTSSALVLGSAVHDLVGEHYAALIAGETAGDMPLASAFIGACFDEADPAVKLGPKEDRDGLCDLGAAMAMALTEHDLLGDTWSVAGVEERVEGPLLDEAPPFVGYIDLLMVDDTGQLGLVDFKTTRSRWSSATLKENSGQLVLYESLLDTDTTHSSFVTVTKAKAPKVQQLTVEGSEQQLDALHEQVRHVWRGIESGAFPAHPGWGCGSCGYQDRCAHSTA
jgi:RecB family exonuclease